MSDQSKAGRTKPPVSPEGPINVVVVGQTPPPYGGQAIMTQQLLDGEFSGATLRHVRLDLSYQMSDVGKFSLSKIWRLLRAAAKTLWARIRYGCKTMYYAPGGQSKIALFKDMSFLYSTRWAFSRVVFHMHAGGLAGQISALPRPICEIVKRSYANADCVIVLGQRNIADAQFIGAKRIEVIPNGIPDNAPATLGARRVDGGLFIILYVGVISIQKGALDAIKICAILKRYGLEFRYRLVGEFQPAAFGARFRDAAKRAGVVDLIELPGPKSGPAKWQEYEQANVYSFPSLFPAENLPVTIIEAMQYSLPVLAYRWRSIPEMVEHGTTGMLADEGDTEALANYARDYIEDRSRAQASGLRGREKFLKNYCATEWWDRIERALTQQ